MTRICLLGSSSSIVKALVSELVNQKNIDIVVAGRSDFDDVYLNITQDNIERSLDAIPLDFDVYVVALGVLYSKRINQQTSDETYNSVCVNLLFPVKLIEMLIDRNRRARIIVMGSESGMKGSYDTTYFLAKAALASYVREKHIKFRDQQLIMIAPSIIEDAPMTRARADIENVVEAAKSLPKGRLLLTEEIVALICYLIHSPTSYINNEIINVNGGKFARMKY